MGLNINYFYSLTPRQFANIHKGYQNKKEQELRMQLLLNRRLEFAIAAPYLNKNTKLTEQTYRPFYWEEEQNEEPPKRVFKDKAEMQKLWEEIDQNKTSKE